jgi:hypothetical protein
LAACPCHLQSLPASPVVKAELVSSAEWPAAPASAWFGAVNAETGPNSRLLFQHIHERKQASGRVYVIVKPVIESAARRRDHGSHLVARQIVPPHELA